MLKRHIIRDRQCCSTVAVISEYKQVDRNCSRWMQSTSHAVVVITSTGVTINITAIITDIATTTLCIIVLPHNFRTIDQGKGESDGIDDGAATLSSIHGYQIAHLGEEYLAAC